MNYQLISFETIDSTNLYLKENYASLDSFTFVTSKYQTNGKGRNDRVWSSSSGLNLLASLLIKDLNVMDKFHTLSLGTAYVIAKCLEDMGVKNVSIKWPNDVYVNGKKVLGVLLEGSIPHYLVIGFGLNVNQKDFPDDLRRPATSISLEMGKDIDIESLQSNIFTALVAFIKDMENEKDKCEQFIALHNYLLGKAVKVNDMEGIVKGISPNYELLLDVNGEIKNISTGEIDFIFTK